MNGSELFAMLRVTSTTNYFGVQNGEVLIQNSDGTLSKVKGIKFSTIREDGNIHPVLLLEADEEQRKWNSKNLI